MLGNCWNECWDWRINSNQIWHVGEKCVRALCCFEDGQLIFTPKSQSSGIEVQGSHECGAASAQHVEVKSDNIKFSHLVLRPTHVLYGTKLSNVFSRKQLKLCRKDLRQRKREEERGRGGQTSRAAYWSRVVVGFNPGIAQEHAVAHHEMGENMPGSACSITEYKGGYVPACFSETTRAISSYIFFLQLKQSIYHSVHQLCCNSIFKVWSQLHLNCHGSGFTSNNINLAKIVWPFIVISSTNILMEMCVCDLVFFIFVLF